LTCAEDHLLAYAKHTARGLRLSATPECTPPLRSAHIVSGFHLLSSPLLPCPSFLMESQHCSPPPIKWCLCFIQPVLRRQFFVCISCKESRALMIAAIATDSKVKRLKGVGDKESCCHAWANDHRHFLNNLSFISPQAVCFFSMPHTNLIPLTFYASSVNFCRVVLYNVCVCVRR